MSSTFWSIEIGLVTDDKNDMVGARILAERGGTIESCPCFPLEGIGQFLLHYAQGRTAT
jgi:hypothetical protein